MRDGVRRETGLVDKFPKPRLDVLRRAAIGCGYRGPTAAEGRVYATDRAVQPKPIERVHCLDAKTGESTSTHSYDRPYRDASRRAGPPAYVSMNDGRPYAMGTRGHPFRSDAAHGAVHWPKDLAKDDKVEMPIWELSASPVIEANVLIGQVGGENACPPAYDRKTGDEPWRALDDKASHSAPIAIDQAGRRLVIVNAAIRGCAKERR
jgi:hypothetical protein